MWMFNDCWPTSNWSIIDYYRQPKPSYYAAMRACRPLLPMIVERAGQLGFFFGNDTRQAAAVELHYGLRALDGQTVWSRSRSLCAAANGTICLDMVPHEPKLPTGEHFFIDATIEGKPLPRVIYFADGWKDIDWPEPHLALRMISQEAVAQGWRTRIHLTTRRFARMAHVLYRGPQAGVWFSDNYFDLAAGDGCDIMMESPGRVSAADLQVGHWLTEWE